MGAWGPQARKLLIFNELSQPRFGSGLAFLQSEGNALTFADFLDCCGNLIQLFEADGLAADLNSLGRHHGLIIAHILNRDFHGLGREDFHDRFHVTERNGVVLCGIPTCQMLARAIDAQAMSALVFVNVIRWGHVIPQGKWKKGRQKSQGGASFSVVLDINANIGFVHLFVWFGL